MPTINWSEGSPQGSDSLGQGDDDARSTKSAIRTALDFEHIFPAAGGDAGIHRLGSGRPYVTTQSLISSSGTDGRLAWASDTSNFFHVGSGGTAFIGGARTLSMASYPGSVPQRHYWTMEVGIAKTNASGQALVNFSAFSGVPFTVATPINPFDTAPITINIYGTPNTTAVQLHSYSGSVSTSNVTFFWQSTGTRAF